jgi:hypothetical protein
MNLDPEPILNSPFFIGLLGAVVALRGVPGTTWKERIANAASGSAMAGFFSPAAAEYFDLSSPSMRAAAAFAIGLFGLNLMASLLMYIRNMDIAAFIPWGKK